MSKKVVYFFLQPQGPPESSAYQHCAVAIAEGLRSLGLTCFSNLDYWRVRDDWLFRHDPAVQARDCPVVIWGDGYPYDPKAEGDLLDGRRTTVYVDSSDGWRTQAEQPRYRRFDVVLRTHCNAHYRYPANVHPWAFGLTERIIAACEKLTAAMAREPRALFNFRVGHPVRRVAEERVAPLLSKRFAIDRSLDDAPGPNGGPDRLYWEATGRRHYPGFYDRLRRSLVCAAFGGYFAPGRSGTTERFSERVLYKLASTFRFQTGTVMQFDSWRFWESLAAGCLTLQVDYGRYGCRLPEEPRSRVHYCGIEFGNRESESWILEADVKDLELAARSGREWALEHYSPRATARRLLKLLDEET